VYVPAAAAFVAVAVATSPSELVAVFVWNVFDVLNTAEAVRSAVSLLFRSRYAELCN
jgi:hypothetical protein